MTISESRRKIRIYKGGTMAKAKTVTKNEEGQNPGILFVMMFVIIMAVNAVIIHLANGMYPTQVVLGTISLSYFWALMLSSGVLSLLTTFAFPFISDFARQMRHMLSPIEMIVVYFVVNFVGLWFVTRVSQVFGLGVSSWMVVLVLAAVLDFVQGMAMMLLEKVRTK